MGKRVVGAAVLLVAALVAPSLAAPAAAVPRLPLPAAMCPPTTLADLFPETPEAPTPSATPDSADQPEPAETTTTTTPPPDTTTTTLPPDTTTTTTVAGDTTTTTTTLAVDEGAEAGGEGDASTTTTSTAPPPPPCTPFVYDMLFPTAGGGIPGSPFGADRDGGARHHEGVDVAVPKLVPVVAVADGRVDWVQRDAEGRAGVAIGIRHPDGWRSLYIHLNDDTYGSEDGLGNGVRPGLEVGDRVVAGQVIGWVGDSGNAEGTSPHLHFELRRPDGAAVDPMASLRAALGRSHPVLGSGRTTFDRVYLDAATARLAYAFDLAVTVGLDLSCDDYGLNACPGDPATGGEVADWIAGLSGADSADLTIGYPPPPPPPAVVTMPFELAPRCGLYRFCPDLPVTRGEVAAMVSSALGGPSRLDLAYARLHDAGDLDLCVPGADRGGDTVTRSEALVTMLRAFGYLPSPPCSALS